jgi:hypothetical protein
MASGGLHVRTVSRCSTFRAILVRASSARFRALGTVFLAFAIGCATPAVALAAPQSQLPDVTPIPGSFTPPSSGQLPAASDPLPPDTHPVTKTTTGPDSVLPSVGGVTFSWGLSASNPGGYAAYDPGSPSLRSRQGCRCGSSGPRRRSPSRAVRCSAAVG